MTNSMELVMTLIILMDIIKMYSKESEISDERKDDMYPCFGGNGLRGYT